MSNKYGTITFGTTEYNLTDVKEYFNGDITGTVVNGAWFLRYNASQQVVDACTLNGHYVVNSFPARLTSKLIKERQPVEVSEDWMDDIPF